MDPKTIVPSRYCVVERKGDYGFIGFFYCFYQILKRQEI